MHTGRNLVSGAMGGLTRGAGLGLIEAVFHLVTSGAPDLWSPLYGIVLYGLIGVPFGIAGGIATTVVEALVRNTKWKIEPFLPFVAGEICASIPMLGFIAYYLGNKVVFAEQGVPMWYLGALAAFLAVFCVLNLILGRMALTGFARMLLKPQGAMFVWLSAALLALLVALLPLQADPRSNFAAGKPVPGALSAAPNVLFIMVDTLRGDHLGTGLTPNLDRLAEDGVAFDNAFAQASWTRSSGASLWTSRLPSGHNADTKASRLSQDAVLWSETLQDAGVTTGALVNNINMTESFGFNQGFDSFLYEAPDYRFGGTESVFALTFYKVVHKVAEKVFTGNKQVASYYQPAPVVLADAQAFIEANSDSRWALFVHLMEPHDPYFEHPALSDPEGAPFNGVGFARAEVETPDPADAEYLRAVYADEVRWMDREVAPFFEWLRASGNYDDTVIVLTSDHGEEFYEHGGWWHGTTLYDEQIHVPLVVKPASGGPTGVRIPWQVRNIDVAPTLTAAMGIAADPSWVGHDLMGAVTDWQTEQAAAADAAQKPLDESPADGEPDPADDGLVVADDPCVPSKWDRVVIAEEDFEGNILGAVRHRGMKLIRANAGNPRGLPTQELFDITADPGEQDSLTGKSTTVCGQYVEDWGFTLGELLASEVLSARDGSVSGGDATMTLAECQALVALGYLDNCDHL